MTHAGFRSVRFPNDAMARLACAIGAVALSAAACALGFVGLASASGAQTGSKPVLPSKDPFYRYGRPLAHVAPGTVLKKRNVKIAENGNKTPVKATQILYRTTGELGQPELAVTTVIRPAVPELSTRIVSYQTAYDALGSQCDPSYTLRGGNKGDSTAQSEEQIILGYVAQGYTVLVPDYEGVNLRWVAGQQSGYGTLDGIRATENLLKLSQSKTPVGLVGYSGGSIATDFGAEVAGKYARQLHIVGAAEGGVPVDLAHNLSYINGSPSWSGIIPAVLLSLGRAFGVNIDRYASAYGRKLIGQEEGGCINNYLGKYPGLKYQRLLKPRYVPIFSTEVFVRIVNRLIMSRTGTPREPMLIGVGQEKGQKGDGVMVAADDEALAHAYCTRKVPVVFKRFKGLDHTDAAVPFEAAAMPFLEDRLNGLPAVNECSKIGRGDSIAPVKRQHH